MTYYIYSTHTNSVNYVIYDLTAPGNVSQIKWRFRVQGGHGLPTSTLITPRGVVTKVDRDSDMETLLTIPAFQKAITNGYISYEKRNVDPEKATRSMNLKDGSSQKTPSDYKSSEEQKFTYKPKRVASL